MRYMHFCKRYPLPASVRCLCCGWRALRADSSCTGIQNLLAHIGGSVRPFLRRLQHSALDVCRRAGILARNVAGAWGHHPTRLEGKRQAVHTHGSTRCFCAKSPLGARPRAAYVVSRRESPPVDQLACAAATNAFVWNAV